MTRNSLDAREALTRCFPKTSSEDRTQRRVQTLITRDLVQKRPPSRAKPFPGGSGLLLIPVTALFVCATLGYTTGTVLFRERASLAYLRHHSCCLSTRARRARRGGGGGCGFRPGGTAQRGLSGVFRLEDTWMSVLRASRGERPAAHGRLRPGGPRRHRTVSQTWAPRAGPRAHDGRALVRGNQRHGPHHDAAAFGGHPYGREPPPSCGSRVRAAEPGCEPLGDDRPLRQPAEPVSLFLLRARPRRFPGRYGTALRAVDRRHRRLHLVAVRSVERQLWPRRYAQSRRADAAQQSTERLSPSLCWPYSASCPSPPPSPS